MSAPSTVSAEPVRPGRIESIDLLRGLDVWLMLFVNEMAGVKGTPAFLLHFEPRSTGDGMTITDVVFPAFLFIVGLAIPFAFASRRRDAGPASTWRHILTRTAGLLAMGVLMVNGDEASPDGMLPPQVWNVLMIVGVILAWSSIEGPRARALRSVGVALLGVAVLTYRSDAVSGLIEIRPHWWGILGLIGWAYLVSAGLYAVAGDRPAVLMGGVALLYAASLADEVGGAFAALRPFVHVGRALAAHSAVTLSGVVLGVLLMRERSRPRALIASAAGYAAALAVAGWLLHALRDVHPAFTINKIRATAPWCLYSSAWTCAAWVVLFAIVDVAGRRRWPGDLFVAGRNALPAYLLPSLLLSLFALSAPLFGGTNPYHALGGRFVPGLIRSIVFAWIVVRLCELMRRSGLRMQL